MDESQGLGAYLRSQRQGRGLSLKHISDHTKISVNHLQAMETGCYEQLPTETYLRGFLVCYAGFLDLPVEKILEMYRSECPEKKPSTLNISAVTSPETSHSFPTKNKSTVVILLVVLLIITSGGVIWWSVSFVEDQFVATELNSSTPAKTLPSRAVESSIVAKIDPSSLSTHDELIKESEVSSAMSVVAVASATTIEAVATEVVNLRPEQKAEITVVLPSTLQLNAISPASIEVTIDGRPTQLYDLQPGSRLRWQIRKYVVLKAEPENAVLISFAGKDVSFDNSGRYVFPPVKD